MENKATPGPKKGTTTGKSQKQKKTLTQLLHDGLKDIYSAENQLVQALPKMAKASENEELQHAFEDHLRQTKKHVERLEKIFDKLGVDKGNETCEAMQGLIKEGEEIIEKYEENSVRDSALIIAAQKIEHYEIASYGSLCELADVLGMTKVCDILGRTLDEEKETDEMLSDIAQDVNDEAYDGMEDDDTEDTEEDNK